MRPPRRKLEIAWVFPALWILLLSEGMSASALGREPYGASLISQVGDAPRIPPVVSIEPTPDAVNANDIDSLLNLAEKDLSQLANVKVSKMAPALSEEVSTVSRTKSTVGKTPAAVFVITNEMIRRSGSSNIPDVLRMAPGIQVARVNSNGWAVTARGFNGPYANKLLVQIDGRSTYTPLFSGTLWETLDVVLEDVERIEVIRGPGATVWGANAVNGVINIITKKANQTQGVYAQAAAGTYERGQATARYGGKIGENLDYRAYGKWNEHGVGTSPDPTYRDDWQTGRGGFRMDWRPGGALDDSVTFQGDAYANQEATRVTLPVFGPPFILDGQNRTLLQGGNGLMRWTHTIHEDSEWQVQTYYDYTNIDFLSTGFQEHRNTYDLDFQHRFKMGEQHKLVWGGGFRSTTSRGATGPSTLALNPITQRYDLYSAFLQDEISLSPDRWYLTLGSKFQYNSYTHFEYQPTAKLLFTPDERQSVWCSVSRAVRTPSRAENGLVGISAPVQISPVAIYPNLQGNPGLVSENLLAWEFGYRAQPTEDFSYDIATFFNQYRNLIEFAPFGGPVFTPYGALLPSKAFNNGNAETYGVELASNYSYSEKLKYRFSYSFLEMFVHGAGEVAEGQSPQNQFYLQQSWTPRKTVELDLIGRYVDKLAAFNVPSYFATDIRLAYRPRPEMEWFVVGRGLFCDSHAEYGTDSTTGTFASGVSSEVFGGFNLRR